jgi:hypothetical protein
MKRSLLLAAGRGGGTATTHRGVCVTALAAANLITTFDDFGLLFVGVSGK